MFHKIVFIHTKLNIAKKVDDREVTLRSVKPKKQLKERQPFNTNWQHKLKTFHPFDLNEKEEYSF